MKRPSHNKLKLASPRLLVGYILLVFIGLLLLMIFFNSRKPSGEKFATTAVSQVVDNPAPPERYEIPVLLEIPSINLNAPIEQISLTPDGSLATPIGKYNVGWYRLGPRPGEVGSAIIDGHYGQWEDGSGSVFDNINKLVKGDKIYIVDADGNKISFVVRETRSYDPDTIAPEVFNSSDGKAHLNLITCQGDWDKKEQTFTDRLVIFADLQQQ